MSHRDRDQHAKRGGRRDTTTTSRREPSGFSSYFNHLLPTFPRQLPSRHRHSSSQRRSPLHDRNAIPNKDRGEVPDRRRGLEDLPHHVNITLRDLAGRYDGVKLAVKNGVKLIVLEDWVKANCRGSSPPLSDSVQVRFFADGRELGRYDPVAHPVMWYRLTTSPENHDWKITHLKDGVHKELTRALADEVTRCIEDGHTVGQLRELFAKHMNVVDDDRVIIATCDGVRLGSLQGDMWEVRQIRGWFCRWLSVEVRDERAYAIIDGPWGQYRFHPSKDYRAKGVNTRDVKDWLRDRCLNTLDRRSASKLRLHRSEITLTSRGRRLSEYAPIHPGATVKFEIPWDLERLLALEESWLLPASETCTVCTDDKKPTELALPITGDCKHKSTTCRECLKQWIHSSLETSTWDRLRCPECPAPLQFDSIKRYASKDDFERYDTLATRAALKSIPSFRWCLSTTCESGQIHDPACSKFKCIACKAKHCVYHNKPWHSGETCKEYDRRNRHQAKDDKASEEVIKKTTKPCPECHKSVHKYIGCNHITCVCGHEWCYICLAPFQRTRQGLVHCRHKPSCTEVDPLADIIDAEGNIIEQRPQPFDPIHVLLNRAQRRPHPPRLEERIAEANRAMRQLDRAMELQQQLENDGHLRRPAPAAEQPFRGDFADELLELAAIFGEEHRRRPRLPRFADPVEAEFPMPGPFEQRRWTGEDGRNLEVLFQVQRTPAGRGRFAAPGFREAFHQ